MFLSTLERLNPSLGFSTACVHATDLLDRGDPMIGCAIIIM